MCLVEQPHDPLLLPCDTLLFVCWDRAGRSDSAGECGRRRLRRQLTWIGHRAALARCERSDNGSRGSGFLLYSGYWTARVMLDSRPLASAGDSADGLMAQAAARILSYPDERWIVTLEHAGRGAYIQQRTGHRGTT